MKIRTLSIVFIFFGYLSFAQELGNEWIDFNQRYFKIKIAEDGVYRIDAADLVLAGVPVSSIPASRFQIFRRGNEIGVRKVSTDNILDYLEFYGEKNDGESDTPLYMDPLDQPHTYYNLFTDTASYFLTWKLTGSGKSIPTSTLGDNTGLTPEPWHLNQLLTLQTNAYSTGLKFGANAELSSGLYEEGEGWTGSFFSKNQNQTFNFTLSDFDNTGSKPSLEIRLIGGNSLSHNIEVSAGPNTASLRVIENVSFSGWTQTLSLNGLEWSDIAGDGSCVVRVTALGVSGQADRVSVSYLKIEYPQNFGLGADENKPFYQNTSLEDRTYLVIPTTNAAGTRVIEFTDPVNPRFIVTTSFSDRMEFVVPDPSIPRSLYAFTSTKTVGSIEEVSMEEIDPQNATYLLLSSQHFHQPAGDGMNPVDAYKNYRESNAGGNYSVTSVTIEDVFNQYGYGDPTSLSIRNFVNHALAEGDPEHLFIVGKGLSTNHGFYRKDPSSTTLINHVPSFGFPGSDVLFSVNVNGNPNAPALGVGRLNAYTPDNVKTYLDKVKEMEALPFNMLWRKKQLFLSGGQNTLEQQTFSNYVENFKRLAEYHFLGGKGQIRRKITTDPTEVIDIQTEINSGLGMVTLFGHSSAQISDIEIGDVNDHENTGKYPIFLVNGCNAGEIFGTTVTFGEDWVNAPALGASAFIAHADFSQSVTLKRFSDLFFQEAFNNQSTFGNTLGHTLVTVGTNFFNLYGTSPTSLSQIHLMSLLGDPAIKPFGVQSPDYESMSSQIYAEPLSGNRILASQNAFSISLMISNYGMTQTDSIDVEIKRTLPDGKELFSTVKIPQVFYKDTVTFLIENDPALTVDGNNLFQFTIDPENLISEINEANNISTFELFLPRGNTINLYPVDLGIQSEKEVEFIWQSAELLPNSRGFILQYDSVPDFSSPLNTSQTVQGQFILRHTADLTNVPDSTTIFWRTKYANPSENEDTAWVSSSFSIINSLPSGWGQMVPVQYESNTLTGTTLDPTTGAWDFEERSTDYQIVTHGIDHPNEYEDFQVIVDNVNYILTENTFDPVCRVNTINAVFIDRATGQPYRPISFSTGDVTNPLICGRVPQMIHNLIEDDVLGSNRYLDSLISLMKPNDYVLLFSFDSVAYSNWDTQLFNSLNTVGIQTSTLSGLVDGQPAIFLGKKGSAPGEAIELTSDGTVSPPKEQLLSLEGNIITTSTNGSIETRRIGPAKSWNSLYYEIIDDSNDDMQVEIVGITKAGVETPLFTDARIANIDVSTVNASTYPFLKLNVSFSDQIDLTPPQLKALVIDYDWPPEGLLFPENSDQVSLMEGDTLTQSFLFVNVSKENFIDSLQVNGTLLNIGSSNVSDQVFNIAPTNADDTTTFTLEYATRNMVGTNNLSVRVSPQENELLSVNNYLNFPDILEVTADETNPVLDVTFDGSHILDGDIVSPNPDIFIRIKDENPFLYKEDTSGINLSLKLPCEGCQFERIDFSDPGVTYIPASEDQDFEIHYQPGQLEDGIHAFRVAAEDESGNSSGDNDYEISFEVINESTITHFYPYPNPFSTSTRFVFTLTGGTIPDQIKIQIMTISGRVVREITQDEIGPVKIGNNITEYAWDGRDEYGDLLANGVYLYRVFIESNGESLKHRFTSADRAFKNGYGKIYILR